MLKDITVKLIKEGAKAPTRAEDSIGYDLYSCDDVVIPAAKFENGVFSAPGKAIVSTGVSIAFNGQPKGLTYGAFIWDRSSMGSKGIRAVGFECFEPKMSTVRVVDKDLTLVTSLVAKHAGCIEGSYRGEWKVVLVNLGSSDYSVSKGDRIAQVVFQEVEIPKVNVIEFGSDEMLPASIRGTGGFGSTGV